MYERLNVASYISADITKWLSTSLDMRYTKGDRDYPDNTQGYLWDVRKCYFMPTGKVDTDDGQTLYWETPANYLKFTPTDNTIRKNPRIFSHTDLHPIKGLNIVFEYTYNGIEQTACSYTGYFKLLHPQNTVVSTPSTSRYYDNRTTTDYNSINANATYVRSFGDHNLKFMGGFTQETSNTAYLNVNRLDMINPELPSISGGIGETTATDQFVEYIIRGGYGRINYDYQGKYLLEVNGRYDGSSRFPKKNRFGFFPSASVGWQIGKEKFMNWSHKWLNELKVRASYGEIGNQAISDYGYFATMNVQKAGWIIGGERFTELLGQGFGFYDIRRWKTAPWWINQQPLGVYMRRTDEGGLPATIKLSNGSEGYILLEPTRPDEIQDKGWDDTFYLYPIPRGQFSKNPGLTQNPGWDKY